jgi:UDP-N-acetylglucosamine acyltransferase
MNQIHHTALVHPEAKLGVGVAVGPYSVIGPEAVIGDRTQIGSHVVIENRVHMGVENQIYHGAVIGTAPQDLKYEGDQSSVVLGDRNTIREYATINIATDEADQTSIGNSCLLMAYAHVAHNCELGDNIVMANSVNLAGHVRVGDWAIIGGMCAVHQFVLVGAHAFIGGLSRLSQDVPPFTKVAGSPPAPAGINSLGLERRGYSADQLLRIKDAYRLIYRRGLRREEALEKICEGGDDGIAQAYVDFFDKSDRGIVR